MRRFAVLGPALALLALTACGTGNETTGRTNGPNGATLPARTIEAGDVTVKIEPVDVDADGASFDITLDTHSVELDMDIAKGASLQVDGEDWTGPRWDGDGPQGHHREGTLSFDPGGTATEQEATLSLDGFPTRVVASWELDAG